MRTKERIFWKWSPSRKVRRHRERQWWRHFDKVTETRETMNEYTAQFRQITIGKHA